MCDNDSGISSDESVSQLRKLSAELERKMKESLTADQLSLFEEYLDAIYALGETENIASFALGMRFGADFMNETLCDGNCTDKN